MKTQFEQNHFDNMRQNPENYIWGVFYFNKKDSRVILPKSNSLRGWTLNFASPYTYLSIIAIIGLIFLMKVLK
jgi:uncharacterized membrane protein